MSRMFVGLHIPDEAALRIKLSIRRFREYSVERLPTHRWHLTLFFLGDVGSLDNIREELLAPITSSFVPTVRLTHLGAGRVPGQLWAYAEPNQQLTVIHQTLRRRAHMLGIRSFEDSQREFVPHIRVANISKEVAGETIPDWPLLTTFSATEAQLFKSEVLEEERRYAVVDSLPLTAQKRVAA